MRWLLCSVMVFSLPFAAGARAQSAADLPSAPPPSPESYNPNAAGIYKVGEDVRPPVLVYQVDPEFTEQARRKHVSGNIQVGLIVDEKGLPQNVHVVHGLGLGLDEKAVEAVRGYRFQPARKNGAPVPVELLVEVNFQIF